MKIEELTKKEVEQIKNEPDKILIKPNAVKAFVFDIKFPDCPVKHVLMSDIVKIEMEKLNDSKIV